MVKAKDPFRAYELLSSVSLKDNIEVEKSTGDHWVVRFSPNVSIKLKARDPVQARRAAEWAAYLDRRELHIESCLELE